METFTELKDITENPYFQLHKQKILYDLNADIIDMPIVGLVNGFNKLPYCFTLQSCYGHFVYNGQKDTHNLDPLPAKEITDIDPENIQFGCAEWFWGKNTNSYALQVEPDRFKYKDTALIDFREALHIEKTRNTFFIRLYELLGKIKAR